MVDIGILDDDTVIVEQRDIANDGEIVVVMINGGEVTLKHLKYRQDGSLALIVENTSMAVHESLGPVSLDRPEP